MNMTIGGHHCTVTTSFHAVSVVIHIPTFLDIVVWIHRQSDPWLALQKTPSAHPIQ